MKKLKALTSMLLTLALAIGGSIYGIKSMANLFYFMSWLITLSKIVDYMEKEKYRPLAIAAYRDPKGPHLPPLVDHFFYTGIIAFLACQGWFVMAVLWVFTAGCDLNLRKLASETSDKSDQ